MAKHPSTVSLSFPFAICLAFNDSLSDVLRSPSTGSMQKDAPRSRIDITPDSCLLASGDDLLHSANLTGLKAHFNPVWVMR